MKEMNTVMNPTPSRDIYKPVFHLMNVRLGNNEHIRSGELLLKGTGLTFNSYYLHPQLEWGTGDLLHQDNNICILQDGIMEQLKH